jgi:hypothetical protein
MVLLTLYVRRVALVLLGISLIAWNSTADALDPRGYACPANGLLDPYEIWDGVSSDAEATAFLKATFAKINDTNRFVAWLKCQGFEVDVNLEEKSALPGKFQTRIDAGFYVHWVTRPALWDPRWIRFPPVYAHSIELHIVDGRILAISVSNTIT